MRIVLSLAALIIAAPVVSCGRSAVPQRPTAVAPAGRFDEEIRAFEDSDRVRPPTPGGVVFVGSSSIRLWPDLRADFPGTNVLQRGFGGSRIDEVLHYAPRIVLPYKPKLVVLYAGDNDLAEGRTPEQIFDDYKSFVRLVHDSLPGTRVAYVSIKPSPSRWSLIEGMRSANQIIRDYATSHPGLLYVDVLDPMIGSNGRPRPNLYLSDSLHMTHDGYAIWRSLLMPIVSTSSR